MVVFFKGYIIRFVNKDNNVINVKEMEKSVFSYGGFFGIRVVVFDRFGEFESIVSR